MCGLKFGWTPNFGARRRLRRLTLNLISGSTYAIVFWIHLSFNPRIFIDASRRRYILLLSSVSWKKWQKWHFFQGTYDMKSSWSALRIHFWIIYWNILKFIGFKPNFFLSNRKSLKEEEVKSLEDDKDRFRRELEDEIEYLLNEKNQMQSRHMVNNLFGIGVVPVKYFLKIENRSRRRF